jgi:hypothetical protein
VGRDPYSYAFFSTVKDIGSSYVVYGSLVLIYIFNSRALAFHYTLIISAMMFFLCFMKMIVAYPRPYQVHPDVLPTTCSGQFGCPSATAIRVVTIVTSLFLDFFHSKRNRKHILYYSVGCIITFIGVFGVMASRVYLAAHSIN